MSFGNIVFEHNYINKDTIFDGDITEDEAKYDNEIIGEWDEEQGWILSNKLNIDKNYVILISKIKILNYKLVKEKRINGKIFLINKKNNEKIEFDKWNDVEKYVDKLWK